MVDRHHGFGTVEILTADGFHGSNTRHHAKIGQIVMEISQFLHFSKMAAVRHLGFAGRVFGPPANSIRRSLSLYKVWLQSVQ